jgi:tRNA (cytidine/uridine-2'-O-)-methyltransferase
MNIVLYEPDIPWNTGNVGRTCVATGSQLHLVGKLGFSLDGAQVKRSGLDYWDKVQPKIHPDWDNFLSSIPKEAELFFFSKKGKHNFWQATFRPESYLIFGCETRGLPSEFHERYGERMFRIPIFEDGVRSLNLSTAAGVVLYEALRQTGGLPLNAVQHPS